MRFPVPPGIEPGVKYVWAHPEVLNEYEDKGYSHCDEYHDYEGDRYRLIKIGEPLNGVSAMQVAPDLVVALPDEPEPEATEPEEPEDTIGVDMEGEGGVEPEPEPEEPQTESDTLAFMSD